MEFKQKTLIAILVAMVAFAAYARTLPFDLVWDDKPLVSAINTSVREHGPLSLLTRSFTTAEQGGSGYYRPIPAATLWLDSALQPVLPVSFHLTSVLIHSINALLVYLLFSAIFRRPMAACFGAFLFAVHPGHVESVAFVSGRTDTLAALFALLSVICWLKVREDRAPARKTFLLLGAAAYLGACLSKETAFILPGVMMVWSAGQDRSWKDIGGWLRKNRDWLLSWSAALLAAGILRIAALGMDMGVSSPAPGYGNILMDKITAAQWLGGLFQYMKLSVIPWPGKLLYTPDDLALTPFLLAGAGLFIAVVWAASRARLRWIWFAGLAWFLLFLLPVSGVVPRGGAVIAERFWYLPSIGFCILASAVLDEGRMTGTAVRALKAAALVLLPILMISVIIGSGSWRDNISVFAAVTDDAPRHPVGPYNLGTELSAGGAHRQAIELYREALRRDPEHPGAQYNLAISLRQAGDDDEAEMLYREILRKWPHSNEAAGNLGHLLIDHERYGEAQEILLASLARDADDPLVLVGLALVHAGLNETDKALDYLELLRTRNPEAAARYDKLVRDRLGADGQAESE
jgi:hypothetical protein